MGDFGYIGAPSGAVGVVSSSGLLTFGAIFEALDAVGAIHQDLETLRTFFVRHSNHPIVLEGEGEVAARRRAVAALPGPKRPRPSISGVWTAVCDCREEFRSPVESFLPRSKTSISPKAIVRLKAIAQHLPESIYRASSFPLENQEFFRFLEDHSKHSITAFVASADVPTSKGAPTMAVLPSWRSEDHEGHLGVIPEPLTPAAARLHHRVAAVRVKSCQEIGAAADRVMLGYLLPALDDLETDVRVAAIEAIGKLKDPRGVRPLGRGLLDESPKVVRAARQALKSIGVSEKTALEQATSFRGPYMLAGSDREQQAKSAAEIRHAFFGRESAHMRLPKDALRSLSRDEQRSVFGHPSAYRRAEAYPLLQSKDKYATEIVLAGVDDPSTYVQAAALRAALRVRARIDRDRLLELVESGDYQVTPAARSHLARKPDEVPLERMIAAAGKTPRPDILALIGKTGKPAAYTYLAGLYRKRVHDEAGRWIDMRPVAKAIYAWGGAAAAAKTIRDVAHWYPEPLLDQLSPTRDAELLHKTLTWLIGSKHAGRSSAAGYIEKHQIVACYPALIAAAQKPNPEVVRQAWRTLIGLGDPSTEAAIASALDLSFSNEAFLGFWLSGNAKLASAAKARKLGLVWTPKKVKPIVVWGERR